MVTSTLETFRPLVRRRGQTLEVRLPENAPTVLGDPEQLDRVLVNLITNASKYTPDGGQVVVEVTETDGQVATSVSDTGIGIPPAEQARLFERFFRASTAHEQGIAGTGLGLAIVQTIVERHGGAVTLTSSPGEGSCFTVTLPSAPAAAPSRPRPEQHATR
jgi:signal transduction histidine kinase